ncbi:conserved hypothetical protein [Theileria orientalis strain Shintoku]|uniref:Uncharacterized protein n=1 Tax=Theileria orientalis strain Shintoku TaxID=869250 RepID=J7MEU4_THEOR|nr:conserved hypothetical protein [Theileria orientalis strain Shintoku]PVC54289.1 hypothetical protein MACL_00003163 [Theileria orientalis]BAM38739.1 conserved hypothetical protein [Theileria orientalis strain Shintoku]|eukprot:XP_009689040.1 conserved hypothetical protein [Theileria orientalis strain Shintoku]
MCAVGQTILRDWLVKLAYTYVSIDTLTNECICSHCLIAELRYARDSLWGDLWRFSQREEKPVARGYTPRRVINYLLSESEREEQVRFKPTHQLQIKASLERTEASVKDKIEEDMIRNYSS